MPNISLHRTALSVAAQQRSCLRAKNSRKHNASDEYAAAVWLAVARKVCEQDAYQRCRVKRQQLRTWGKVQVLW